VKLPVALLGGRRANSWPLAGAMLSAAASGGRHRALLASGALEGGGFERDPRNGPPKILADVGGRVALIEAGSIAEDSQSPTISDA
jgi:hypothetical protein